MLKGLWIFTQEIFAKVKGSFLSCLQRENQKFSFSGVYIPSKRKEILKLKLEAAVGRIISVFLGACSAGGKIHRALSFTNWDLFGGVDGCIPPQKDGKNLMEKGSCENPICGRKIPSPAPLWICWLS